MLSFEDKPYRDVIEDWFKRIGYAPVFYESHTPVRVPGSVKRLTKRERERVDSLSKERGYRRFHASGRVV
ncbi:MAG: hypothetical protein LAP85_07685 [Acidobacteriia bacterium]|nr:hypothetical protein [Terriglobia bacterium]